MNTSSRRNTVVNIVGGVGYLFLVAAWAFFAAVIVALFADPAFTTLPTHIALEPTKPNVSDPSMAVVVASYAITALMIVVSIVALILLPYLIGKWGSRFMRWVMILLGIDITKSQLFLTKSTFATLPLVGLIIINFTLRPESVTFGAMYVVTVFLSAMSIVAFLIQLLVARRTNTPIEKTW